MQFGEFIKQQRVKKSIGRSRLGQMVDRSAATIARWERGEAFPVDDDVLVSLGEVLEVEVAELESLLRESRKAAVEESAVEESAVTTDETEPAGDPFAEEVTAESSPTESRAGINLAAAVGGVTAAEDLPPLEDEIAVPEDTVVPDAVEAAIFGLTTAEQPALAVPEETFGTDDEAEVSEPDFVADPFGDGPTGESEAAAIESLADAGVSEAETPAVWQRETDESESDADEVQSGVEETSREDQTEPPADEESTAGDDEGTSEPIAEDEEEVAEATAADDFFGILSGGGEEEPGPEETPAGGVVGVAAATAAAAVPDAGPDTVETAPPPAARSSVRRGQRRQAPTDVAYDTLGPVSYTESRRQMRTYRIRTALVVAVMVVLGMLFLWAMTELWEAIGDAWQSF